MKVSALRCLGGIFAFTALCSPAVAGGKEVNLYSMRRPSLLQPLLDAFAQQTGIRTNLIYAEKGLIVRIAAEGENSPADVLLVPDIGSLATAVEHGVTQPIASASVTANIPSLYRDPEGQWVGLSARARVVYASAAQVRQDALTYEDLADPRWKGKVCIQSGQRADDLALVASMLAHSGEAEAKAWLQGVKANLAGQSNTANLEPDTVIMSGKCDLVLGTIRSMSPAASNDAQPEHRGETAAVKVLVPHAAGLGPHVNISGVVLAKNAPNRGNAIRLIEFLTSDEAQEYYAASANEYPLKAGGAPSPIAEYRGVLNPDPLPLAEIAKSSERAAELLDEVAFDQGPNS